LKEYLQLMNRGADAMLAEWEESAGQLQGREVEAVAAISRMTLLVVGATAYGSEPHPACY
jgi:hypothetical protein